MHADWLSWRHTTLEMPVGAAGGVAGDLTLQFVLFHSHTGRMAHSSCDIMEQGSAVHPAVDVNRQRSFEQVVWFRVEQSGMLHFRVEDS